MRFAVVLGLLIATPALACPDLSGFYEYCYQSYGGETDATVWNDLDVTQTDVPGGVEYTLNLQHGHIDKLPADGKTTSREVNDGHGGKVVQKMTNTCDGDTVVAISVSTDSHQEVKVKVVTKLTKIGRMLIQTDDITSKSEHHYWVRTCN